MHFFTTTILAAALQAVVVLGQPPAMRQFVLVAPAIVRMNNRPYSFFMTLFENQGYSLPVTFLAELVQDSTFVLASQQFTQTTYDPTQFTFSSRLDPRQAGSNGQLANLTMRVTFSNANLPSNPISSALTQLMPEYHAFIQTDKQIYRPGQIVYMTAFMLDRDLKSAVSSASSSQLARNNFTVSVKDAAGNLVGLWQDVTPKNSVWSSRLTIPPMVNNGIWTIFVNSTLLPKSATKTFTVAEYELPRFEVDVSFPDSSNWLFSPNDDSNYIGRIAATYTFGKPVRGSAKFTLSSTGGCNPDYDNFDYSDNPLIFSVELYGDGADEEGNFKATKLNDFVTLRGRSMVAALCVLTFDVEVTDRVSGTGLRTQASVVLNKYQYELSILDPPTGRPLLPRSRYNLRVKTASTTSLTDEATDGLDVQLETVMLRSDDDAAYCLANWRDTVNPAQKNRRTLKTDANGFVSLTNLNIDDPSAVKIGIKTWMTQGQDKIAEACNVYDIQRSSAVLISVDVTYSAKNLPKINDRIVFKVSTNFNGSVYFALTAPNSGQIVAYRKLASNSFSPQSGGWLTSSFTQLLNNPIFAPRAIAIAWSIDPVTNELMSDVVSFKVEGLVKQNVTLAYDEVSTSVDLSNNCPTRPKSERFVNVLTTEPRSVVALIAMDKKVKLLPRNQQSAVTNDAVLRMIDPGFGLQNYDNGDTCWSCGAWIWYPVDAINSKRPENVFKAANLMVIIGYTPPRAGARSLPTPTVGNSEAATQKNLASQVTARRNLPEVWFWFVGETDDTGELHVPVTLPDTITSWVTTAFAIGSQTGFGALRKPVELMSRKLMFVDLVLPQKSVIFGEEFAAPAAVYNYAPVDMTINLKLEDTSGNPGGAFSMSTNGGASYNAGQPATKTVNVPANSAVSFVVWIRPLGVGKMPMRLTATGTTRSSMPRPGQSQDQNQCYGLPGSDSEYESGSVASFTDTLEILTFTAEPDGKPMFANKAYFFRVSPNHPMNQLTVTERELLNNANPEVVPDSKMYEVGMNGDLLGPVLSNFGDIVRIPSGCGEQLMKSMMPNAFVYKYLKSTNQLIDPLKSTVTNYVLNYLPQLMAYQNPDGGFSVWGPKSVFPYNVPETWLTAFIVRYLTFCSKYVDNFPTDRRALEQAYAFLSTKVNNDGSVTEAYPGATHPEMKGGSWRDDNLAIYVYATFAENDKLNLIGNLNALQARVARVVGQSSDPYQLSLAAYATSWNDRDRRELSQVANNRLMQKAIQSGQPSTDSHVIYWVPGDPSLYPTPMQRPSGVETSGYALLSFINNGRTESPAINRWLVSQRNSLGGYDQTQETVVGLHALSEFAAGIPNSLNTNMNVTATFSYTSGYKLKSNPVNVNANNSKVFQRISAPRREGDSLQNVQITAEGSGYLYVQVSMRYNVLVDSDSDSEDQARSGFKLFVNQSRFDPTFSTNEVRRSSRPKRSLQRAAILEQYDSGDVATTRAPTRRPRLGAMGTSAQISGISDIPNFEDGESMATRPQSGRRSTSRSRSFPTRRTTSTTTPTPRPTRGTTLPARRDEDGFAQDGIGDDVSMKVCLNATQDAQHGMVAMEIFLPSGFAADLEKTKRLNSLRYNTTLVEKVQVVTTSDIIRDPRLQQIELEPKSIVYYFDLGIKLSGANSFNVNQTCCVMASMFRQVQVRGTKPPIVNVFNYYRPVMNQQVSYNFTNMAMPGASLSKNEL